MQFRILGPVQVLDGDRVVPLPAGRVRALLAVLLLHANHVVTVDELADCLWDESAPDNPRAAVQTCVRRLRQALGNQLIDTRPRGYLINVDPAELDLSHFRQLVGEASRTHEPAGRARLLSQALDLCRGQPLADLNAEALAREAAPRLVEERLHALEQLLDARLQLGEHTQIVAELTTLTREQPQRERFWAQLMLALHRSGRQADALDAYRTISRHLAGHLGIDPGDELRRLHQAVLTADPKLAVASPTETAPAGQAWVAQSQLPLDVGDFVGRHDLIDDLENLLTTGNGVPVVTVSGPPGIGKTALAVRVAHRLRSAFPDGQWYVRLDGAGDHPRDPADLLAELLRTSGIDGAAIPGGLDARAATIRSRLADRRVLLLLDDAATAEQVRPLLPGTAGSAVLVTSRPALSALTVLEGARGIHLGVLDPDEAGALLVSILGARAISADTAAVADLAKLCGHLPLALRIAAANLATRPDKSITTYATELRSGDRLAKLAVPGEPQIAVRAAFDLAYAALDPQPQRLFRLLGLIPGTDFTAGAAAALLDATSEYAERTLDELATANLVQRHAIDRYVFHDLLRLYAADLARSDPGREPAWRRLCDWYLATADAAIRFGYVPRVRLPGCPQAADRPFGNAGEALEWLDAERANLAAVAVHAADAGPLQVAWLLPNIMCVYLYVGQHMIEWRAAIEAGLRAAKARGDRLAEGAMRHIMGGMYGALDDMRLAVLHERIALECYREAGLRVGEAMLLSNLADSYEELGEPRQALRLLDEAITLGHATDVADADMSLAVRSRAHLHLGELDDAIRCATECLAMPRAGSPRSQAVAWRALIYRASAHRLTGEYARASADITEARRLIGDRLEPLCEHEYALLLADTGRVDLALEHAIRARQASREDHRATREAYALNVLGQMHRLRGEPDCAAAHHDAALQIATAKGYRAAAAEAHVGLARVRYDMGQPAAARRAARKALVLARNLELRITECLALLVLAATSDAVGETADASRYAEQAGHVRDRTGYRPPTPARRGLRETASAIGW